MTHSIESTTGERLRLRRPVRLTITTLALALALVWTGSPATDSSWTLSSAHAQPRKKRKPRKQPKKQPKDGQTAGQKDGQKQADSKPWYQGVSVADQDRAKGLFGEGVALHKQLFYAEAIAKYKEALSHWDHPDIHYNLARAYISQGKPVEAYGSLQSSMKFGKISLTEQDWATAKEYQTLLEGQLARVQVKCATENAVVTVDDQELFRGPGEKELLVVPGPHRVIARKDGYMDADEWLQINPGETKSLELNPLSLALVSRLEVSCTEPGAAVILDGAPLMACPNRTEKVVAPSTPHLLTISRPGRITSQQSVEIAPGQSMKIELETSVAKDVITVRRYKVWQPWAVAGTGAALGLVGGLLQWRAVSNIDSFNREFAAVCSGFGQLGCFPNEVPHLINRKDAALRQNRLGITFMALGGATLVAGISLALLNQPRLIERERKIKSGVSITPTVSPRNVGLVIDYSY